MRNSSGYSWEIHPDAHEIFIRILMRNSSGYSWEIHPDTHEKFIWILMRNLSGYSWEIHTFLYSFDTVLYQLLKTGTSDRTLICLRFSGFSLYPLSYFLYSPFKFSLALERFHRKTSHNIDIRRFNRPYGQRQICII